MRRLYHASVVCLAALSIASNSIAATTSVHCTVEKFTEGTEGAPRFSFPVKMTFNANGEMFVADLDNRVIRKVTASGVVTTFAGTPEARGDVDGMGTEARFMQPSGVAVDHAGNLFVVDRGSSTLRRISPEGVVTTIAGSPGETGSADGTLAEARFNHPYSVTVDGDDNIFIADSGNNTIRKITPAGQATTIAGLAGATGSTDGPGADARFDGPTSIAVDGAGNLYVADASNHTVRKISPDGVVTTLAGKAGVFGFLDGHGSDARFQSPSGIAVDHDGNVYVTEPAMLRVRKITPEGDVSTLVNDDAGMRGPEEIAVDDYGTIYVSDVSLQVIWRVDPDGGIGLFAGTYKRRGYLDGVGATLPLTFGESVTVDGFGNVYFFDAGRSVVQKKAVDGTLTTLAGMMGHPGYADGRGSEAQFGYPWKIAADSAGNVFVADRDNYCIRKITPDGTVTTIAGKGGVPGHVDGTVGEARFIQPYTLTVDSDGTIYVGDGDAPSSIRKISPDGIVTTIAGFGAPENPMSEQVEFEFVSGVAVASDGNVYACDWVGGEIFKITPDGILTTLRSYHDHSVAISVWQPVDMVADRFGFLYLAETEKKIRRIGLNGTSEYIFNSEANSIGIVNQAIFGVAVASDGTLYAIENHLGADDDQEWVYKVNPVVKITSQPATKWLNPGESVTFHVDAVSEQPLYYEWRKNGSVLPDTDSPIYSIANVQPSDEGIYSVDVYASSGNVSSDEAQLAFNALPIIGGLLPFQKVVVGGTIDLLAVVGGTPPFSYQWKRNGVAIPGATDAHLALSGVGPSQGGQYTLVISNPAGMVTSDPVDVQVDTSPRLINLSCRALAGQGDNTLIMGFYLVGTEEMKLLVRGVGPGLAKYDVPNRVADPRISVYWGNQLIASNDDWDPAIAPEFARAGAFDLEAGSMDAAMVVTLQAPGIFTVHLVNDGAPAEALIEVYDLSRELHTQLTNVSCRMTVQLGQTVILGTAQVGGSGPVLIRNVGPGLAAYRLDPYSLLNNPYLKVFSGSTVIAENDDWTAETGATFGEYGAFWLSDGSKDAAVLVNFQPGSYTVHALGNQGRGGVALVEIYGTH